MRTTNSMLINNMIYYMGNNLQRLGRYQTQMATGKKITVPSDDPVAAARALKLRTDVSEVTQFKSNSNDAYSWMDTTEAVLAKLGDVMQVAQERAVQAANGTMTPDDRKKIMQEVAQLRSQIIHMANTSYAGRYVFSGFSTDTKLMNDDGTYAVSVSSSETAIVKSGLLELKPGASVDTSVNNAFEISLDGVNYYRAVLTSGIDYDGSAAGSTLDDLAREIQNSISAASAVGGAPAALPDGMESIRVINNDGRLEFSLEDTTDNNGNKLKIFLRETAGADNLLKSINIRAEGMPGLTVSGSEEMKYQVGIGDLLEVNVPGTDLFGSGVKGQTCDFIRKFDKFLDSLEHPYYVANEGVFANLSSPVDLTGRNTFGINIAGMGSVETITLTEKSYDGTPGNTLDDLARDMQDQINSNAAVIASGTQVTVVNKGGRLVIADQNGAAITLQQNLPNDALGVLNFKTDASGSVASIASQDGINAAIADMQSNMNRLLSIRSDIGARMNRAELTLNRLDSDEVNFTKLMSNNEDVDMAEVIMNLKNEENVYRASLAGGARIIQPTLVDFLR